jgi:RNA recognition motif-containing protein
MIAVCRKNELAEEHTGAKYYPTNFSAEGLFPTIPEDTTTLMLKNLPQRFSVHEVIRLLDNIGLGDDYYDFFYMPHKDAKHSKCYAFINIPDRATAKEFVNRFDGKELVEGSKKRMQVVRAAHQGVIKNLLTINHMAWSRLEQRPMVRINGRRLHLPPEVGVNMYNDVTMSTETRGPWMSVSVDEALGLSSPGKNSTAYEWAMQSVAAVGEGLSLFFLLFDETQNVPNAPSETTAQVATKQRNQRKSRIPLD